MHDKPNVTVDREAWLKSLQPGSPVAMQIGNGMGWRIGKVVKRTPAGKIDVQWYAGRDPERFPANGSKWLGYTGSRIEPVTPRVKAERRRAAQESLIHKVVDRVTVRTMTDEHVEALANLCRRIQHES